MLSPLPELQGGTLFPRIPEIPAAPLLGKKECLSSPFPITLCWVVTMGARLGSASTSALPGWSHSSEMPGPSMWDPPPGAGPHTMNAKLCVEGRNSVKGKAQGPDGAGRRDGDRGHHTVNHNTGRIEGGARVRK